MITKTHLISTLEKLPENLIDHIIFIEKVQKGLEDSENGRVYSNEEASAQVPDIVFETTNASAQSFSDHDFILNINNMTKNNEICKSRDCLISLLFWKSRYVGYKR